MAQIHQVYLIPGFFGFVSFGRLVYFAHVRELLEAAFEELGVPVVLHSVRPSPTASLRARAAQLVDYMRETAPPGDGPIHLIGHSTGGLDARLAVTQGVSLETDASAEELARRVRTVITVSTPHRGTPLAEFFSTRMGQQLLRLLSIGTVMALRRVRLPLALVARAGASLTRVRRLGHHAATAILEHLEDEMLGRLAGEDQAHFARFFREVQADQALITQLTPAAMDLFNAATGDRPTVRYASVVTRARPPRLLGSLSVRLNPWAQATYLLHHTLHRLAGLGRDAVLPALDEPQWQAVYAGLHGVPSPADNDGIVPTWSQIWGKVLYAGCADHLDVIGHFDDPGHVPPHHDWLVTSSGFRRDQFEALWTGVARFVAGAAAGEAVAPPPARRRGRFLRKARVA